MWSCLEQPPANEVVAVKISVHTLNDKAFIFILLIFLQTANVEKNLHLNICEAKWHIIKKPPRKDLRNKIVDHKIQAITWGTYAGDADWEKKVGAHGIG